MFKSQIMEKEKINSKQIRPKWDNNFHVMYSKNNFDLFKTKKEYFDSPIYFENNDVILFNN